MKPLIHATIDSEILTLNFEDPSSRNSFSLRAARELRSVLQKQKEAGKFKALVFAPRGRVFCSGGNLSDYAAMKRPEEGKVVNREITAILTELSELPVPTICLVNGDCFGGGVELLSAFDFVHSAPHAFFGLWQRKIGLTFGWGGGERLEKRLGTQKLRALALSAEVFSAHEALGWGLVDRVHRAPSLVPSAKAHLDKIIGLPRSPVAPLKKWQAQSEKETFETLWWNEEHLAVLRKFSGKP
jgi:enoyl-CoA hydratase